MSVKIKMETIYTSLIQDIQSCLYYSDTIPKIITLYDQIRKDPQFKSSLSPRSQRYYSEQRREHNTIPYPIQLPDFCTLPQKKMVDELNHRYEFYWYISTHVDRHPIVQESWKELRETEWKLSIPKEGLDVSSRIAIQTMALETMESLQNRIVRECKQPLMVIFHPSFLKSLSTESSHEHRRILDLYELFQQRVVAPTQPKTTTTVVGKRRPIIGRRSVMVSSSLSPVDIMFRLRTTDEFNARKKLICEQLNDLHFEETMDRLQQMTTESPSPVATTTIASTLSETTDTPTITTRTMDWKPMIDIYNEYYEEYEIDLREYLQMCLAYFLMTDYKEFKKPSSDVRLYSNLQLYIKDITQTLELESFQGDYYDDKHILIKRKNERDIPWLHSEPSEIKRWYTELYEQYERFRTHSDRQLENTKRILIQMYSLGSLPLHREHETGRIKNIKIDAPWTTGELFGRLRLCTEIPFGKYKMFYKIRVNTMIDDITNTESTEMTDTHIRLFNPERQIVVFCKRESDGLYIQHMSSTEYTTEKILQCCGLEEYRTNVIPLEDVGIMKEFYIINTKPADFPVNQVWNPMESSIVSCIIMNHSVFSTLFWVNDTEKISRQNKSIFLYFKNIVSASTTDIFVGGWNRTQSRLGDLTAIMTPIIDEASQTYQVHVKITRSRDLNTIKHFQMYLIKLLCYYNSTYQENVRLWKEIDPLYQVPSKIETVSFKDLPLFPPALFNYKSVVRGCQKPRKCRIVSDEEARRIPEERRIQYPPLPVVLSDSNNHEIVRPQWYVCDDKKHRYPQMITNYDKHHPLGYVPCCFIKPQSDHEMYLANIERRVQGRPYEQYSHPFSFDMESEKRPVILSQSYTLRLRQIQHLAIIQTEIQEFLKFLWFASNFNSASFYRLGTSNWLYDSLLSCLEYGHCKIRNLLTTAIPEYEKYRESFLRSPRYRLHETSTISIEQLRNYIASFIRDNSMIALQNGQSMESYITLLQNPYEVITIGQFLYILQEFYHVNLCALVYKKNDDDDEILSDICTLHPSIMKQYIPNFQDYIQHRPFLFVLEHQSKQIITHYELIVYSPIEDIRQIDDFRQFTVYSRASSFLQSFMSYSFCSYYLQRKSSNQRTFPSPRWTHTLSHILFHTHYPTLQYVDLYGKTNLLGYKIPNMKMTIMVCLWNEITSISNNLFPLQSVHELTDMIQLLNYSNYKMERVINYLEHYRISYQIYTYGQHLYVIQTENYPGVIIVRQRPKQDRKRNSLPSIPYLKTELCIIEYILCSKSRTTSVGSALVTTSLYDTEFYAVKMVHILQDYCLYSFSRFVQNSSQRPLDEIETWMEQQVLFKDSFAYPSLKQLSCRFEQNTPFLFEEGRLILITNMKERIRSFLQWFLLTQPVYLLQQYTQLSEIPSYYQFITDFPFTEHHVIQTTLRKVESHPFDSYLSQPLSEIPVQSLSMKTLHFYIRWEEFSQVWTSPIQEPYLLYIFFQFSEGQQTIYQWLNTYEKQPRQHSFLVYRNSNWYDSKDSTKRSPFSKQDYSYLVYRRMYSTYEKYYLFLIPYSKIMRT